MKLLLSATNRLVTESMKIMRMFRNVAAVGAPPSPFESVGTTLDPTAPVPAMTLTMFEFTATFLTMHPPNSPIRIFPVMSPHIPTGPERLIAVAGLEAYVGTVPTAPANRDMMLAPAPLNFIARTFPPPQVKYRFCPALSPKCCSGLLIVADEANPPSPALPSEPITGPAIRLMVPTVLILRIKQ